MSRTDVHRPWRVQAADPDNRHRLRRFQMYPPLAPELVPTYNTCGCPMCTGRHYNRAERRRERHTWRRRLDE